MHKLDEFLAGLSRRDEPVDVAREWRWFQSHIDRVQLPQLAADLLFGQAMEPDTVRRWYPVGFIRFAGDVEMSWGVFVLSTPGVH